MGDELEWIKWFPHKYRDEVGLRFCSFAAEGLWMAILMRMHTNDPYGHLTLAGRAPSSKEIAKILGKGTASQIQSSLEELEHERVFSRTPDGIIYCRRMVRDNRRRLIAKENGSQGGNPALLTSLDNQNGKDRLTGADNQNDRSGLTTGITKSVKTESESEGIERVRRDRKNPPKPPKRGAVSDLDFDAFWKCYPRKVGRDQALRAWIKALKGGITAAEIHGGLSRQTFSHDPQFIKHPASWLNAGCWKDEPMPRHINGKPADKHAWLLDPLDEPEPQFTGTTIDP